MHIETKPVDEVDAKAREVMESEGVSYGEALEMLNVGHGIAFERSARHGGIERRFGPEEERLAALRKELGSHDLRRFTPSNAGAYEDLERRIREIQCADPRVALVDATKRAFAERGNADRMDVSEGPARKRDDYLGASISSLMAASIVPDRHGSRSAGRKAKKKGPSAVAQELDRENRYNRACWSADRAVSRALRAA